MTETSVTRIHFGPEAVELAADAQFRAQWDALLARCAWATPFQRLEFAAAWFDAYRGTYEPFIVAVRGASGELIGGFAGGRSAAGVFAAGGWQAEYPCWLAREADAVAVFDAIVGELEQRFGTQSMLWRYLPSGFPLAALLAGSRHRGRLATRAWKRPVMDTASPDIEESLRKKGNKSKLSRLKRRGAVEFRRITDLAEFERDFDSIIAQYDARQKEANGIAPFEHDKPKRAFHVDLMRRGLLHVSVLRVGDAVGAAHVGVLGPREVHLAIVCFDPAMADDSPNKLLLLMLGQQLKSEGVASLDLTPGGDAWKDRFANRFDEVHELTLHKSAGARLFAAANAGLRRFAKRLLRRGPQPAAADAGS
jgi:CelD/BcsL family acetyltransferase involved in cellulose biosynthesis